MVDGGGCGRFEVLVERFGCVAFSAAKDFEDPDDADSDGTYELTVRVSDGQRAATGDVEVSLADRNEAPTADAGADHTGVAMGATVTLAGSGTDPDAGTRSPTPGPSPKAAASRCRGPAPRRPPSTLPAASVRMRRWCSP